MAGTFFASWKQYRAFRRTPRSNRRIVFYAESGQDWHHWRDIVRHLTGELGETICYVSSDPDDPGLQQDSARIRPVWIGRGLCRIWFFQWLEADVMVTQLLDLGNLDLKRSVNPVHYVYVFHSLISTHMAAAFFVVLYAFPAGMVLYWASNNFWHLVKVAAGRLRR